MKKYQTEILEVAVDRIKEDPTDFYNYRPFIYGTLPDGTEFFENVSIYSGVTFCENQVIKIEKRRKFLGYSYVFLKSIPFKTKEMLLEKEKDYSLMLNELFLAMREYSSNFDKKTFSVSDDSAPRIEAKNVSFSSYSNDSKFKMISVSVIDNEKKCYPIFDLRAYDGVTKFTKTFGEYKDLYLYVMDECLEKLVADIKSETDRRLHIKHDKEIEEICKRRKEEQSLILAMKARTNSEENVKMSKSDFYKFARNNLYYLINCVIKSEKPSYFSSETLSQMLMVLYDEGDISLTEMQTFQTAFELEKSH